MDLTLSKVRSALKKTKLEKQFTRLWREVKGSQHAMQSLEADLADLHTVYLQRILPVERSQEQPYMELTQRLIKFMGRKSLTNWQRAELEDWILDCLARLSHLNPQQSQVLEEAYQQQLAAFLQVDPGALRRQMTGQLDPELEIDAEAPGAETITEAEQPAGGQADLFAEFEFESEPQNPPLDADSEALPPTLAQQRLTDDNWLITLFRRTASALHPDKEIDEAEKANKQVLMSRLLKARQDEDILTLLGLYTEHVDDDGLDLSDNILAMLCDKLKQQKQMLMAAKAEMFYENPLYGFLYDRLHSSSEKIREKRINQYLQSARETATGITELNASLRNLTVLKEYLELRYEDRMLFDE